MVGPPDRGVRGYLATALAPFFQSKLFFYFENFLSYTNVTFQSTLLQTKTIPRQTFSELRGSLYVKVQ